MFDFIIGLATFTLIIISLKNCFSSIKLTTIEDHDRHLDESTISPNSRSPIQSDLDNAETNLSDLRTKNLEKSDEINEFMADLDLITELRKANQKSDDLKVFDPDRIAEDLDLIANLRKANQKSEELNEFRADLDLIAELRKANKIQKSNELKEFDLNLIAELQKLNSKESPDKNSLEFLARDLIAITQNIAGVIDNAQIPSTKKEELANLLKGVPKFINQIVEVDNVDLENILHNQPNGNVLKESDFLMKTLDTLRSE